MSEENAKLVRSVMDAWNRGDYDAWIAGFDRECEFWPLRAQLERQPYRGHHGLRQFMHDLNQEWTEVRFALSEVRDVGDQVLVLTQFHARGRASGAEIDIPIGVIDIPIGVVGAAREGKIVQARLFSDPHEALEAVGLRE